MRTAALLCLALGTTGCATLTPLQPVGQSTNGVRVVLTQRDRELFKLAVYNSTNTPIVVNRDAIVMQRPFSIEPRQPGGIASAYLIPAGGSHAVNVKFSLAGLHHGDPVWIEFPNAVIANGQPVEVDPIELRVD